MFREVSRDKRQILTKDESIEVLKNGSSGVLSLQGDNDYPYGVPLNYAFANNKLYFHGMPTGHKIDSIKRNPKVSFTVIDQDEIVKKEYTSYFKSVIVFGTARIIEDIEEKKVAFELLVNKYMPEYFDGSYELLKDEIAMMSVIEVDAEHISGKQAIELAAPKA